EKKQTHVRKQKMEQVPRKKRGEKWVQPNKGDAEARLAERLSQLNRGEFVEPSSITFEEFKDTWLKNYALGEVSPTTMDQYESLYKNHIIPHLGGKKLSQIGVEDIQGFKSVLQQKGLGEQMVKHNLLTLRNFAQTVAVGSGGEVRYPSTIGVGFC
ncbi:MAG: N-terminal phage integrase SAM-like domain-containing protein, partial [Candidatus Latescibacteria bacterium]|nr:N-terminal phage integrase SAM-like domain-containing protein [Candidatus Latescibacterota bacterium]